MSEKNQYKEDLLTLKKVVTEDLASSTGGITQKIFAGAQELKDLDLSEAIKYNDQSIQLLKALLEKIDQLIASSDKSPEEDKLYKSIKDNLGNLKSILRHLQGEASKLTSLNAINQYLFDTKVLDLLVQIENKIAQHPDSIIHQSVLQYCIDKNLLIVTLGKALQPIKVDVSQKASAQSMIKLFEPLYPTNLGSLIQKIDNNSDISQAYQGTEKLIGSILQHLKKWLDAGTSDDISDDVEDEEAVKELRSIIGALISLRNQLKDSMDNPESQNIKYLRDFLVDHQVITLFNQFEDKFATLSDTKKYRNDAANYANDKYLIAGYFYNKLISITATDADQSLIQDIKNEVLKHQPKLSDDILNGLDDNQNIKRSYANAGYTLNQVLKHLGVDVPEVKDVIEDPAKDLDELEQKAKDVSEHEEAEESEQKQQVVDIDYQKIEDLLNKLMEKAGDKDLGKNISQIKGKLTSILRVLNEIKKQRAQDISQVIVQVIDELDKKGKFTKRTVRTTKSSNTKKSSPDYYKVLQEIIVTLESKGATEDEKLRILITKKSDLEILKINYKDASSKDKRDIDRLIAKTCKKLATIVKKATHSEKSDLTFTNITYICNVFLAIVANSEKRTELESQIKTLKALTADILKVGRKKIYDAKLKIYEETMKDAQIVHKGLEELLKLSKQFQVFSNISKSSDQINTLLKLNIRGFSQHQISELPQGQQSIITNFTGHKQDYIRNIMQSIAASFRADKKIKEELDAFKAMEKTFKTYLEDDPITQQIITILQNIDEDDEDEIKEIRHHIRIINEQGRQAKLTEKRIDTLISQLEKMDTSKFESINQAYKSLPQATQADPNAELPPKMIEAAIQMQEALEKIQKPVAGIINVQLFLNELYKHLYEKYQELLKLIEELHPKNS